MKGNVEARLVMTEQLEESLPNCSAYGGLVIGEVGHQMLVMEKKLVTTTAEGVRMKQNELQNRVLRP